MTTDPESTYDVLPFWFWFENNLHRFKQFEDQRETLMQDLGEQLQEVDEGLVFELSLPRGKGTSELIISADGIPETFPAVLALIDQAPDLPGWTFTPFRQREDLSQGSLQFGNREFSASDFYFWLHQEDGDIGLFMFVPGLTKKNWDEMIGGAFILLDMALGEYDATMNLSFIKFRPLPDNPKAKKLLPLTRLPRAFDTLFRALNPE
ncbi:hypothetical protein Pan153_62630 [Gimesia panareensis]|uniref:DUF695 domain-containing protein n=1 Tax=Gimesia panareensis TaxID=2527978 RepID=A0A518FZ03_9PLAN|nr:hypothetical protein [Gimesia panareensis]QDV21573.1 hypothetical protein Pan153_62630 [Gimesia panareensis]